MMVDSVGGAWTCIGVSHHACNSIPWNCVSIASRAFHSSGDGQSNLNHVEADLHRRSWESLSTISRVHHCRPIQYVQLPWKSFLFLAQENYLFLSRLFTLNSRISPLIRSDTAHFEPVDAHKKLPSGDR